MSDPALRFLCFGAGAIGTYIGGSLALAGQPVTFIERPEVAAELRQRGLRLRLLDGEHTVTGAVIFPSIAEALATGPFDAAIFAVKSFDTQAVLDSLAEQRAALPPFVALQNGVENEARLAAFLGSERVIPATVTTAIGRRATGDIVVERLRGLGLFAGHPLSERLLAAMNAAGLQARGYADPLAMKWSKLLTNLIANATSAILDLLPAQIFADRALFRVERRMLRETLAVMDALHVRVVGLPGTPVRALAFGVRYLPDGLLQPLLGRAAGSGRGAKMPSFHIDLHAGRGRSEVDYLNGAVVRAGKSVGIPTPVNHVLTDTLLALASGAAPVADWRGAKQKLLARIDQAH